MGRAPCCDKANVKKGPWSPEEDAKLKSYIEQHGTGGNWIALPQKIGLKRCGKSCRLRWLNYLRPNIKHGGFSEEEDNLICSLYISIGSRWSIIAAQLPGRTDNDIKNYWNTRLKKKLLGKHRKDQLKQQGKGIKSESKNANANFMVPPQYNSININQYWPELPAATNNNSNQEPTFNDHASIRKLLIKLGGRFSEDGVDDHDKTIVHGDMNLQFPAHVELEQYNINNGADFHFQMLQQGQSSNCQPQVLDGISDDYSNATRSDGLEFLYADDHIVSGSWTDSTYEATVGMIQASFHDGLSYSPVVPATASGSRIQ